MRLSVVDGVGDGLGVNVVLVPLRPVAADAEVPHEGVVDTNGAFLVRGPDVFAPQPFVGEAAALGRDQILDPGPGSRPALGIPCALRLLRGPT